MAAKFSKGRLLGEGTWGHVFEAERKCDGEKVAIKRIKPNDAKSVHLGLNFTALREIKFLKEMKSRYIVNLLDTFLSDGVLHLVLEFCPLDLEKIIRDKSIHLRSSHVKAFMQMILRGLEYLHDNFVLHRDLKPANLLIGYDLNVKLADFGLARSHSSPDKMTNEVVTRWYRSPELLFGARNYSVGVDMWAVGCIFAELKFREAIFRGNTDIEQLQLIFNMLGTPVLQDWPDVQTLPQYVEFEYREPIKLGSLFNDSNTITAEMDLLQQLLKLNPLRRIAASEALSHSYFSIEPLPSKAEELPIRLQKDKRKIVDSQEIDTKRVKLQHIS